MTVRICRFLVALLVCGGLLVAPAATTPAVAGPQGSLRAADPTLVRDGDTWVSLSTNESLSAPFAVACNPSDPVWSKGFAFVPYRTGPAPDRLGDCWGGDVLPNGPGPWADRSAFLLWAPSIARINGAWWLFYAARRAGTGQQCVGVAAGDRATGPNWLHPAQPLICPAGGNWAIDPEVFFDRLTRAWYLLWRQDPGFCESRLLAQRFDPTTAAVTGPVRQLLSSAAPALGFDEFTGAPSCPGGLKQIIENPTMVRADSGTLWLFFSANAWDTVNYATGWALCGTGAPTDGASCAIVNAFDQATRNRPWWGASARTAPTPGSAAPVNGFPDLPGFGGLSLAVPDPTGTAPQPVYATAHLFWGDTSKLRTQVTYQLDTTGTLPALYETEPVTIHGRAGSFGPDLAGPAAPSGQPLATRAVPGWGWPAGHRGIFNAVTADGTFVIAGANTDVADDMVAVGLYDARANQWTTVNARTSGGATNVTPIVEGDRTFHGGAEAWDVQVIGDGNAIAFSNIFGVPAGGYFERRRIPPEGVWPSFGIVARVGEHWRVVAEWTAAQLAVSNVDSDVDERACAPYQGMPDATSLCGGPNEMAPLPRSRDLIVALYAGDGRRSSGGLMALRVTGGPDYTAKVVGYYPYPEVPDIYPPDPARPGNLGIATPDGASFRGVHGGIYDYQGNLWSGSDGLLVWSGGPECPFDPIRWESQPESYTSTALGRTVWGQTCPPDYDLRQGADVGGGLLFGNFLQLAEDPVSRTIVGVDTSDTGNVIAVRHAGTGRTKTFTIGNLVDTGRNLLPRQGPAEQRPPAFDRTGRMWVTFQVWPPSAGFAQPIDHWVASVDLASLFVPAPTALSRAAGGQARIQAEHTRTTGTVPRAPGAGGTIPVDSTAHVRTCFGACADDGVPGDGYRLAAGTVEYQVYAPTAGAYQIAYRVSGTADGANPAPAIQLIAGGATQATPVNTGGTWRQVTGPTIQLAAGVSSLRLSPPAGGGNWHLNWFTLTRV